MRQVPARDVARRLSGVLAIGLAAGLVLVGCGDDDESAQDRYCAAGEQLEASITDLASLDLIAEGTNGLESAVDAVDEDLSALADAASEAAADEIDALEQSLSALDSALSGLAGEISAENVEALTAAVQAVGTSAQAVYGTLSDCD